MRIGLVASVRPGTSYWAWHFTTEVFYLRGPVAPAPGSPIQQWLEPGHNQLLQHTIPQVQSCQNPDHYTVKKRFTSFPSPAGMSITKLPLGRNNSVMTSLFPPRESLVVTSRLGTGNSRTFFLRCRLTMAEPRSTGPIVPTPESPVQQWH